MLRILFFAESWLIICGSGSLPNPTNPCWYQLLEQGMTKLNAQINKVDTGKKLTHLEWPNKLHKKNSSSKKISAKLPNWLTTNAPKGSDRITSISPSKLGLNKSIIGPETEKSNEQILSEGSGLHLLLEHLPKVSFDSYQEKARDLLSGFNPSTISSLTKKVIQILNNKDYKSFCKLNSKLGGHPDSTKLPNLIKIIHILITGAGAPGIDGTIFL